MCPRLDSRFPYVERLEARIAPATFRWLPNLDGIWNSPANWFNEFSGLPNDGFPNTSADTAKFLHVGESDITVTIGVGVTITVGGLQFNDDTDYTIANLGSGRMIFDGPGAVNVITEGAGTFEIGAPVTFNDAVSVLATGPGMTIFSDGLSGGNGLTKLGDGTLRLSGGVTNTYTGTTTLQQGRLELQKAGGIGGTALTAIAGPLMVGDGTGTDTVKLLANNQIVNSAMVTINSSGLLELNGFNETLGPLVLHSGGGLAGQITTGDGTLTFGGNVVSNGGNGVAPAITGNVALGSSARTITTSGPGGAGDGLTINGVISGGVADADALIKAGSGALVLGGSASNTFIGGVQINEGTLKLSKSAGVAIPNALTIGDGTAGDVVSAASDNNIADTAMVTVNETGTLSLGAFSDTIGSMALASGPTTGAQVATTTGTLTLLGDVIVNTVGNGAVGAFIGGQLALGEGAHNFSVINGNAAADLNISAAISGNGGLTVGGNSTGTLRLSGTAANTYTGGTSVLGGTLELNKTAGLDAVPGALTTAGGDVRLLAANQIADATVVGLGEGDLLALAGLNETIGGLMLARAGAAVTTGAGLLTVNGNITLVVGSAVNGAATITGNLSMGAATRTFDVPAGLNSLIIEGPISGADGLTKIGEGTMSLRGTTANTYPGTTTVLDGGIELEKTAGVTAIAGPLVIGDGIGLSSSADVRVKAANQIADSSAVTVRTEGSFFLSGVDERIGELTLESGTERGATVGTGLGKLTPGGNINLNVTGDGTFGARLTGFIDLPGLTPLITVGDGAAAADLELDATISGASGGFAKLGPGTLRLSGIAPNTLNGSAGIVEGTVELDKNVNANALSLATFSLGKFQPATLRLLGPNQIANATVLEMGAVGLFDLNGQSDTIGGLILAGSPVAAAQVTTGAGVLTLAGNVSTSLTSGGGATPRITGNLALASGNHDFLLADGAAAADLEINGVLSGTGGFTLPNPGTLRLSGSANNSYSGATNVTGGVLELAKTFGIPALAGPLNVGGGSGIATVRLAAPENIPSSSTVTVKASGLLDLNGFNETIGPLNLETGGVGGSVAAQITTGAGTLTLVGNVTVTGGNPSPATIGGKLDFGSSNLLFSLNTGSTGTALDISAAISGIAGSSLTKIGTGGLQFSGTEANTFAGIVAISEGTLTLAKTAGVNAIAGEVQIGGTLVLTAPNNISDAVTVVVNPGGAFDLNGVSETIGELFMTAGGTSASTVTTGAGTLTLAGKVTVLAVGNGASGAVIEGKLSLGSATRTFNVANSAAAADLSIAATISGAPGAGLTKTGAGTLIYAAGSANTYSGPTTVNDGFLELRRGANTIAVPGTLTINAGGTALLGFPGQIADAALVTVSTDGTLNLGGNSGTLGPLSLLPGSLITNGGTLTLDDTLTLSINSSGAPPARIDGEIDLAGAPLVISTTIIPSPGETLTVLDKTTAGPITGTFAMAANGATLQTPGGNFTISYTGGLGSNNVLLTPVFITPVFSNQNRTATYTERDGDVVTIKTTRGAFAAHEFVVFAIGDAGGGQLARLTLGDPTDGFSGANLSFTAKRGPSGGNGFVNVGFLDAAGIDLGTVSIAGDLSGLTAGTPGGNPLVPGLKALAVQTLGALGATTQTSGGSTGISVQGGLPKVTVAGDIRNSSIAVAGSADGILGTVIVGGSIAAAEGGRFSIFGQAGIRSLKVAGDIRTATDNQLSSITSDGAIGTITVGGSIDAPVGGVLNVQAFGKLAAPVSGIDLALAALNVRGSVRHLEIIAGRTFFDSNADASVGAITVGGDWIESSVRAGASAGADAVAGTNDDAKLSFGTVRDNPAIFSTIQSITIKGQALGSPAVTNDGFGIVAERIGKAKVGTRAFAFTAIAQDVKEGFFAAPTGPGGSGLTSDFTIREIGSTTANLALSTGLLVSQDGRSATFTDEDGDLVTIRTTVGKLEAGDFTFGTTSSGGGRLEELRIGDDAAPLTRANITMTAKPGPAGGNGFVNIGFLNATGMDLGNVSIAGDLGRVVAGDGDAAKPALAALTVHSLGALGLGTQPVGGDLVSTLAGAVAKLTVAGDIREASFHATGAGAKLGAVAVTGSIFGMTGASAGELSGREGIASVRISGGLFSGAITSSAGALGAVTIVGDVFGTAADPAVISGFGKLAPPAGGIDLAIGSVTVLGSADRLRILAGTGGNADAAIGAITVGRSWLASSALAGVGAGADGLEGTRDDARLSGAGVRDNIAIASRIAGVTIKGQAFGTTAAGDSFGIIAEQIVRAKMGAVAFKLTAGARTPADFFVAGATAPGPTGLASDFSIGEATL